MPNHVPHTEVKAGLSTQNSAFRCSAALPGNESSAPLTTIPIVHSLNRFEANLLTILYAVLGDTSMGQVLSKVQQQHAYSGCLSLRLCD